MATAALSISAAAADFTGSFGKDLNGNGKISVVDNADLTVAVQVFAERAGEIGCRCRDTQGSGSHCNK